MLRRVTAVLLFVLAAGIATAAVLGPLVTDTIRYRTSETTLNQIVGGDLAGLALVAPVAVLAGWLTWRGHRAGPVIGLGPALWAVYMYAQLIVGQEYLDRPGNNEAFFPLLLGLFIAGQAVVVLSWPTIDVDRLPSAPRRRERTAGIVLLAVAAFLTFGLHLPSLTDALASRPTALEYTSSPTAFWVVKLMDLGIIVPAALAIGTGLLRRAPWARKASYALLGGYTLLGAAVAGMAVTMYATNDPDGSLVNVVLFTGFAAALAWLTIGLYRPLFAQSSPDDVATPRRPRRRHDPPARSSIASETGA